MTHRVVVVTGGFQGIGKAIVDTFLSRGDTVVSADLRHENKWVTERLLTVNTDVTHPTSIQRLADRVAGEFNCVDVLVNNAGMSINKSIEELTVDEWDQVVNVNLRGSFLTTKYLLPLLKQATNSSIINIASTRAFMSESNTEAYSASKGGLVALTHALAASLSKYRIRVNCISPGWIHTTQVELSRTDHEQHFSGRVGLPADIASACEYLSSTAAGFITGTNLVIDGGMTVKMIYE